MQYVLDESEYKDLMLNKTLQLQQRYDEGFVAGQVSVQDAADEAVEQSFIRGMNAGEKNLVDKLVGLISSTSPLAGIPQETILIWLGVDPELVKAK